MSKTTTRTAQPAGDVIDLSAPPADQADPVEAVEVNESTRVADLTFDQIDALTYGQARTLAANQPRRIAATGNRAEIINRIRWAKNDPKRICEMCGHVGKVVGTRRVGNCTIRQLRCDGPRRCTFRAVYDA